MNAALSKLGTRWLPVLAPWSVLIVGLAATAMLAVSTHREMIQRDTERFRYEADQLVAGLDTRLKTYVQALMGMREWYSAHQEKMSEATWTNYVYTMDIPRHYPGLYDVGFVEKIVDKNSPAQFPEREAHLQRMRDRLGPEYNLHLPPGGLKDNVWFQMPVIWHSYAQWRRDPVRDYRHFGMDLNQNPDLRWAMNWAFGQEVVGMSGKQLLDPGQPERTGLMIFLPIYRPGFDRGVHVGLTEWESKHADTPEKQELARSWRVYHDSLHGLIFGGIETREFLQHDLDTNSPTVTFALYASTDQTPGELPEQLLFDNRTRGSNQTRWGETPSSPGIVADKEVRTRRSLAPSHLRAVRDLPLYGRVLRFVLEPGPAFASAVNRRTLGLAAGFGVTTTLLLAGFMAYQTRANRKEQEISAALRRSEASLQTLLFERERMSRDLHDGTIQSLYAIGLGLGQLRRMMGSALERERLEAGLTELDRVVAELRGYLSELDPGVSPAQSAATALAELIDRLLQTTATELRFTTEPGVGDGWPPAAVLDLLQVAREGISNALRHGQATTVELSLHRADPTGVLFTISDNGKGFDPSQIPGQGHGLANLERRARAWNGGMRLESRPGGPTRLMITFAPNRC